MNMCCIKDELLYSKYVAKIQFTKPVSSQTDETLLKFYGSMN